MQQTVTETASSVEQCVTLFWSAWLTRGNISALQRQISISPLFGGHGESENWMECESFCLSIFLRRPWLGFLCLRKTSMSISRLPEIIFLPFGFLISQWFRAHLEVASVNAWGNKLWFAWCHHFNELNGRMNQNGYHSSTFDPLHVTLTLKESVQLFEGKV